MSEGLTRRWAAAWAAARDVEVEALHGWPLVHVGAASRADEVVCWEPDPAMWSALLAWVGGDPARMLTVVATEPGAYVDGLPADVRVDRDDEVLMTRALERTDAPAPDGFDVEQDGPRTVVRVVEGESMAAEGTVAVHGSDAAYDRSETTPAFRRRGLGTRVVAALDAHASAAGATTGLLVATPDGAALYARLGWEPVAPVRSLRGS